MTSPKSISILKKTPKKTSTNAASVKGRSTTKKLPLGISTTTSTNKPLTHSESKLGSLSTTSAKAGADDEDNENQPPPNMRSGVAPRSQRKQDADSQKDPNGQVTPASNESQHSSEVQGDFDIVMEDAKSVVHGNESVDASQSEAARRRGGRGRGRKAFSTRSTGGENRSVADAADSDARHSKTPTVENAEDKSDKSNVTTAEEEGDTSAVSAAPHRHPRKSSMNNMPKASSPVGPSKFSHFVAGQGKSARQQSVGGDTSISRSTSGGNKSHRGVVAEMYAHERRHARNKSAESQPAAVPPPHARPALTRVFDPSLRATAQIPAGSTYFPFGLPAIPAATAPEASLSPYGISPLAEPNSSWTTNVYVNNLPPHTTDEDLLRLGSCFGRVKSHKAIINQESGLCKGYGFIMYEFLHDAELAIQQLPLHGLSTSWAKESFSSKLRRMADSTTSNVYLSNLPQDITPTQLESLFHPHAVISLRILTDSNTGKSRGVGFVRLRDRHASQECIERLNGMTFEGHDSPLQVRFADSEAQKQFKMCARLQLSKDAPGGAKDVGEETAASNAPAAAAPAAPAPKGAAAPAFVAALQPQHTWTGFATPASTSGGFSPMLGVMSPQMAGYPAVPPQMAGALPLYAHPEAYLAQFDAAAANFYSGRLANGFVDPYAETQRLEWLAGHRPGVFPHPAHGDVYGMLQQAHHHQHATPMSHHGAPLPSHLAQHVEAQQGRQGPGGAAPLGSTSHLPNNKTRATYLPPDLALQHARALMEKGAQGASQAHAFTMSQQHVEKERVGLLKLLKEANDQLVRLRTDPAADNSSGGGDSSNSGNSATDKSTTSASALTPPSSMGSIAGSHASAFGLQGLTSSLSSAVEPTLTSVTRLSRRVSNPSSGMTGKNGKGDPSADAGQMRQSVSAASLSPLRFLYSKDPSAPISVEAVDVTRELEEGEIAEEEENDDGGHNKPASTQAGNEEAAKASSTFAAEHPPTVAEDEKENMDVDESNECSYASVGGTTSSNNDDSNTSLETEAMQQKTPPEGGKVFEVSLPTSHSAASGLTSIMVKHNPGTEKRTRSKSVVIHAPFYVGVDGGQGDLNLFHEDHNGA